MKLTPCLAVVGALASATSGVRAGAREAEARAPDKPIPGASDALELSLASGYTQGFGNLRSGVALPSVVGAGVGLDLGVGYRISPSWAVLWSGQYQQLTPERSSGARGFTSSLAAQYHFAPARSLDPWLELGAGYRFLWEDTASAGTLMTHGFQLARVRLGLDFRGDTHAALGPVIGADATYFTFQNVAGAATTIDDPRIGTFVYAGAQGRFDIGKTLSARP